MRNRLALPPSSYSRLACSLSHPPAPHPPQAPPCPRARLPTLLQCRQLLHQPPHQPLPPPRPPLQLLPPLQPQVPAKFIHAIAATSSRRCCQSRRLCVGRRRLGGYRSGWGCAAVAEDGQGGCDGRLRLCVEDPFVVLQIVTGPGVHVCNCEGVLS